MTGRPTKIDNERRDNVLRIRLTAGERREVDKAAKAKSLDTSAWARMILLAQSRGG
ncbi:MAG: hypothetical protein JWN40_1660 [Phycisphaerales bacterium]|nr:hypothetical protein [Phycisphaerales bacterium]